jgi:hypothetical protein
MSSTPLQTARATDARRTVYSVALCLALAFAVALASRVLHTSVPFSMLLAGGVAMLALVGLAVARYDLAVALGFALLGFVRFEPAPSDAIFAIVIAVAVATGRLRLDRVPFAPAALVGLLIAVSGLSIATAVDLSLALRFFTISLYMGVFSAWYGRYRWPVWRSPGDRSGRRAVLGRIGVHDRLDIIGNPSSAPADRDVPPHAPVPGLFITLVVHNLFNKIHSRPPPRSSRSREKNMSKRKSRRKLKPRLRKPY